MSESNTDYKPKAPLDVMFGDPPVIGFYPQKVPGLCGLLKATPNHMLSQFVSNNKQHQNRIMIKENGYEF